MDLKAKRLFKFLLLLKTILMKKKYVGLFFDEKSGIKKVPGFSTRELFTAGSATQLLFNIELL